MAQCVSCGDYTKYEGGFCYPCYLKQKKHVDSKITAEPVKKS
jgi:hypothetical protein